MYAEGDGVKRDDYKAFELFSEIADAHADDSPTEPNARFVSSAFVALGGYYRKGIPEHRGEAGPDPRARRSIAYAASYFGDADAQLNLARMYYDGEGGDRDPLQAARWAKLAADKGNVGAQALLGHLLFEGDGVERQPVLGLMYLTVARDRANRATPGSLEHAGTGGIARDRETNGARPWRSPTTGWRNSRTRRRRIAAARCRQRLARSKLRGCAILGAISGAIALMLTMTGRGVIAATAGHSVQSLGQGGLIMALGQASET